MPVERGAVVLARGRPQQRRDVAPHGGRRRGVVALARRIVDVVAASAGARLEEGARRVRAELLGTVDEALARRVGRGGEHQVVDAARVPRELEVRREEAAERVEQPRGDVGAVQLVGRVDEAAVRGADRVLVEHAAQQLALADEHEVLHQ